MNFAMLQTSSLLAGILGKDDVVLKTARLTLKETRDNFDEVSDILLASSENIRVEDTSEQDDLRRMIDDIRHLETFLAAEETRSVRRGGPVCVSLYETLATSNCKRRPTVRRDNCDFFMFFTFMVTLFSILSFSAYVWLLLSRQTWHRSVTDYRQWEKAN